MSFESRVHLESAHQWEEERKAWRWTPGSCKLSFVLWPGTVEGNWWHHLSVFYCTNKILLHFFYSDKNQLKIKY